MARFKSRYVEVEATKVKILEPDHERSGEHGYLLSDGHFVDEDTFRGLFDRSGDASKQSAPAAEKPKVSATPAKEPPARTDRVEDLILKALAKGPLDSQQIIEFVQDARPKTNPQVIRTQLQRMKNDGAVDLSKETATTPRTWFKTE